MGKCSYCGESDALTRHCNHCGKEVCGEHTLPEKHDCPAVDHFGGGSKHLQSDLDARRDPDTETSGSGTFTCSDCDDSYEYFADARHCCQATPEPMANPGTYGGSGRDSEKADFPSSPDVSTDGSIKDDDLNEELDRIRESATNGGRILGTLSQRLELTWLKLKLVTPSLRTLLVILLLGIIATGQLGLAPIPGFPVDTSPAESFLEDSQGGVTNATSEEARRSAASTSNASSGDGSSGLPGNDLNRTEIEYLVHKEINDRRQNRGLQPLSFDTKLRTIARYHSRDMGDQQYFSHTAPDDETMEDRYEKYGYSCRVSMSGGQYATGAENIAYTYAHENVVRENGDRVYYSNEKELAQGLVNQWMNSTGHRKNILRDYWQNEGIGVYVIEIEGKTRVYATQNFC